MKNPFQFYDMSTGRVMENSVGYQQVMSTLTAIGKKVSAQKFYQIGFADFVPVVVGNGAFQRSILNWRSFMKGDSFEAGIISNSGNNARVGLVDATVDAVTQPILSWARACEYNVFELEEAMKTGQIFSLVEMREKSRKKLWDLGLQKVAFLGVGAQKGLLNQTTATTDTSTLTGFIKSLSASALNAFVGDVIEKYRNACARSAYPTHFIIPEADFNGLVNYASDTFFTRTKLEILLEAFRSATGNPNFQIKACAYADKANNSGVNIYTLENYDEESIKMDIPLDYVSTAANSVNGFTWENVAYGQFTGVVALRPLELYYFTHTA